MLHRWLTHRCWEEDVPALSTAAESVFKFLREQEPQSSGTEPLSAAQRADTYTYHYGRGRGARWLDIDRQALWLLTFSDRHDHGYEHAADLQARGRLYPDLDPAWEPGAGTLLPWDVHPDEDAYEWAQLIYGALETFGRDRAAIDAGHASVHHGSVHLALSRDADGIWTLTAGRRLRYQSPESDRGRWLASTEIEELFLQIAGRPAREDYDFDNPPNPAAFLFVDVHFLDGPQTPEQWLQRSAAAGLAGTPPLPLTRR